MMGERAIRAWNRPYFLWVCPGPRHLAGRPWRPLDVYRRRGFTEKPVSVLPCKRSRSVPAVAVRKNRQAFFVAASDDNGIIDPQPAAVESVATIAQLPQMRFTNHI